MTKIYGYSDDNIELKGDINDEIGCYNEIVTLFFSDGTAARFEYPKAPNLGVWACTVINKGLGFVSLDICTDEDADPYSDVLTVDGARLVDYKTEAQS